MFLGILTNFLDESIKEDRLRQTPMRNVSCAQGSAGKYSIAAIEEAIPDTKKIIFPKKYIFFRNPLTKIYKILYSRHTKNS